MITYKYAYVNRLLIKSHAKCFWRAADETSEERTSFPLSFLMFAYISTYQVLK